MTLNQMIFLINILLSVANKQRKNKSPTIKRFIQWHCSPASCPRCPQFWQQDLGLFTFLEQSWPVWTFTLWWPDFFSSSLPFLSFQAGTWFQSHPQHWERQSVLPAKAERAAPGQQPPHSGSCRPPRHEIPSGGSHTHVDYFRVD